MKNNSDNPLTPPQPGEDDIRDYAYHPYQQGNCVPGHDCHNWLEATTCSKANIPAHQSGTRLHQHVNEPERGELYAVSVGARPLITRPQLPGKFFGLETIQ